MRERHSFVLVIVALCGSAPAWAQRGASEGQWPSYGGDWGSTKYSPLDQIDGATVKRLRVVWR